MLPEAYVNLGYVQDENGFVSNIRVDGGTLKVDSGIQTDLPQFVQAWKILIENEEQLSDERKCRAKRPNFYIAKQISVGTNTSTQTKTNRIFYMTDREYEDMTIAWRILRLIVPCTWAVCLYVVDTIADIICITDFCTTGEDWWCGIGLFFLIIPTVFLNVFAYLQLRSPDVATVVAVPKWKARALLASQTAVFYLLARKAKWCWQAFRYHVIDQKRKREAAEYREKEELQERQQQQLQQQQQKQQQMQQQVRSTHGQQQQGLRVHQQQRHQKQQQVQQQQLEQVQHQQVERSSDQEGLQTQPGPSPPRRSPGTRPLRVGPSAEERAQLLWDRVYQETDSVTAKLLHSLTESLPQLSLQAYVFLQRLQDEEPLSPVLVVSVLASLSSASAGLAASFNRHTGDRTAAYFAICFSLGARVTVCSSMGAIASALWVVPLLLAVLIAFVTIVSQQLKVEEDYYVVLGKLHRYLLDAFFMGSFMPPYDMVGLFASAPYVLCGVVFLLEEPGDVLHIGVLLYAILGHVVWLGVGFCLG